MQKYFLSTKTFPFVGVAITLLLLAGCGDNASSAENSNGQTATRSLTKGEFVRRADALCKETKRHFEREFGELLSENEESEEEGRIAAEAVEIIVPLYHNLTNQIRSLGAPSGDEQRVVAFLVALQRRLDYAPEHPLNFLSNLTPFAEAAKLAEAYGLTECAGSLG